MARSPKDRQERREPVLDVPAAAAARAGAGDPPRREPKPEGEGASVSEGRPRRSATPRKTGSTSKGERPRPAPRAVAAGNAPPIKKKRRGAGGGGSGGKRSLLTRFVYWSAVLSLWGVIGLGALLAWVAMHLPPIHELEIPKRPPTVQIAGVDGKLLATRGEMGGAAVALKQMPDYLPKAFIAIEDRRFYAHFGVDVLGLARAAYANATRRGIAQGGSTITQQLAKNLFLRPDRTLMRKLEEVVLALWLEHKFSKAQILELYLNRIYFGAGAYGVEAAAQRYFSKSAREVTLPEAALLAGLVKSPSRLMPTKNYHAAEQRAQLVLAAMVEASFIPEASAKAAAQHPPEVVRLGGGSADYAADWVMDVLNDVVGQYDSDLVVETTLDPVLQSAADLAVNDALAEFGDKYKVDQAALVAMTPDGAVRALIGGRDYRESAYNRAVTARRQPGSAFKPFVYLTAVERGLTPDSVRDDKPVAVKGWKPENYKHEYHGPVTLTQALAQSLNTVAVRLTLEFGPTAVARTAHRLGIVSKLETNASLALGTSEVSVLELVTAYAPFANGGFAAYPHVVDRVRTTGGKVLFARPRDFINRLIEPTYVAMMNQMMRETVRIGTAKQASLPGWPIAGKTGTSQDFRDAWFIGYSSRLLTAVWFGNDDNSPTKRLTGGSLPVQAWTQFMQVAHQGQSVADLPGYPATTTASVPPPPSGVPTSNGLPPPQQLAPSAPRREATALTPRDAQAPQQRPEAIDSGVDGWFLDRLFSRR